MNNARRVSHHSDRNRGRLTIRTVYLKKSLAITILTSICLGIVLHPVVRYLSDRFYSKSGAIVDSALSAPKMIVDSANANIQAKKEREEKLTNPSSKSKKSRGEKPQEGEKPIELLKF